MPARRALPPTASGGLSTDVLSRAATDPSDRSSASLIGHVAPDRPRVYDIIEFLGGERSIEASGLVPRSQARRVRQTANYYRHLGSRRIPRFPAIPDIARGWPVSQRTPEKMDCNTPLRVAKLALGKSCSTATRSWENSRPCKLAGV